MIALLGYIVVKFSKNYLDGDSRKTVFLTRLATTIASVQLLVLSGNLFQLFVFWVITSVCLHYLLIFYRNRAQAVAAARKKFIAARLGDLTLLIAVVLTYIELGTGNLDEIFSVISAIESLNSTLIWATVLLVITAALKSAQFPTYGWLIEVVETPTPVSALLHAGLLNAGPFLIVRLGFLMSESTPASVMLIAIGGFTALFASVVFLTQPSIKVALGYSSVAHMGFMLLICGFGVYTAAILHLVAHSFYKAHAFLSTGSVIDEVRSKRVKLSKRKGSPLRILSSIGFALSIYVFLCIAWGVSPTEDFTLMATGAIIVMGLSQIIVPTLDSGVGFKAILQSGFMALAVGLSFFTLEHGAHLLLHSQIPSHYQPNIIVKTAVLIVVISFGIAVFAQLSAPRLRKSAWAYKLGIHLRNGLYANVLFNRLIGSLKNEKFRWAKLQIEDQKEQVEKPEENIIHHQVINS
jgi:NAD(P)H-quinone oxidoreductase subunit 5